MSGLRWTDDEYRAYLERRRPHGLNLPATKKIVPVAGPDYFLEAIASMGLPTPARELYLWPERDYKADYVWLEPKVIVEKQGYKDHSTKKGLARDYMKSNLAQAAGWRYLQATPKGLLQPDFLALLRRVLTAVE